MDKKSLDMYKKMLLQLKTDILNGSILKNTEDLTVSPDDLPDETDLAASVINQQVSFHIRHKEIEKLRQIEEALQRIEDGTYGICEECDEEISSKRLENYPWTALCIVHAEEKERRKVG